MKFIEKKLKRLIGVCSKFPFCVLLHVARFHNAYEQNQQIARKQPQEAHLKYLKFFQKVEENQKITILMAVVGVGVRKIRNEKKYPKIYPIIYPNVDTTRTTI